MDAEPRFQVTNYHSKNALAKSVKRGDKITLIPIALTRDQLLANDHALKNNKELPYRTAELHPADCAVFHTILGGLQNKQVSPWTATVRLNKDLSIAEVIS